jgi:hypothetical protein
MLHLHRVTAQSGVNLMTSQNLGVVFGRKLGDRNRQLTLQPPFSDQRTLDASLATWPARRSASSGWWRTRPRCLETTATRATRRLVGGRSRSESTIAWVCARRNAHAPVQPTIRIPQSQTPHTHTHTNTTPQETTTCPQSQQYLPNIHSSPSLYALSLAGACVSTLSTYA